MTLAVTDSATLFLLYTLPVNFNLYLCPTVTFFDLLLLYKEPVLEIVHFFMDFPSVTSYNYNVPDILDVPLLPVTETVHFAVLLL